MARNMNAAASYLPMPTPPWKANSPATGNNNFPIPPRNSTNFQWNNAANPTSLAAQPVSFGITDYRQTQNFSDNISGSDMNRSSANLFAGVGNLFDNRNISDGPSVFDGQRSDINDGGRVGGYNDNNKFNTSHNSGSIPDRNGPIDGNFDRGNYERNNSDRGRNFDRNDSFGRGNNFDRSNNSSRNNFNQNDRVGNFNQNSKVDSSPLPPWKAQNDTHSNSPLDSRNNQSRRPRSPEKHEQDPNRRRTRQSMVNNDTSRNQSKPTSTSKTPLKNPVQEEDLELEKRALQGDVTEEFFNKIKPLSLMQVAADVALRYARKEYYLSKGNNQKVPEKPVGSGQYTCKTCYINFLTKEKLGTHNNGNQHKELEDLFRVKKEQAKLIMEKRITAPTRPKLEMVQISRAEVENNLKPTEMELDVYILGVYESVMKPYWPLPKSKYYCRVCNYAEFNSESEMKRHNLTVDHKKREATYEEAFCLYCQQHYFDKANLDKHVTTGQHIKIKDLMERTKECAVEHWHKVNKLDIPDKFGVTKPNDAKERDVDIRVEGSPRVGSKRTASDTELNRSPVKKAATGKPDQLPAKPDTTPKNDIPSKSDTRIDSKKHEKNDIKSNDKKSIEKKPIKSDSRDSRDKKDDSKGVSKADAKPGVKTDSKPTSKTDSKTASKSDSKPLPKSDSKSTSKADAKDTKTDAKSESKSDTKTKSTADSKLDKDKEKDTEKEKVWFAPIKGFMCIACHDFIADEAGQKTHASESKHLENVTRLKKMLTQ